MGKKIRHVHIIINPASGRTEPILSIINGAMNEAGILWDVSITKKKNDGIHLAKAAVRQGVDVVVVYGGDGTVMEVTSGLIGSNIPLAILPGGSANVMAGELTIPKDLKEACKLICEGPAKFRTIDVGQFDKRYFMVEMSLGFEAAIMKGTKRASKNKLGRFAYLFSAIAALKTVTRVRYDLTIDGQEDTVEGLTCIVANAGQVGLTDVSLDRHIDVSDGLLDVVVVRKANLGLLTLIIIALIKGEVPDKVELVKHWQGKDIKVLASPPQKAQCDGEVLETVPSHVKVIPGAIRVLVPQGQ
jgi:diacylglycerol kinase (ATP)